MAMYCLVLFYKATASELKPMKPLPKFLCIKAVVFFSFFQGVLIDVLVYSRTILPNPNQTVDGLSVSKRLQNFLICIEMCMAAVAHHYSFSYKPYVTSDSSPSCCSAFLAMWDISDVQRDISEHINIVSSSISRRIRGRSTYNLAKGNDEYANLMSKTSSSAPIDLGLYQSEDDELFLNYGTVPSNISSKNLDSVKESTSKDQGFIHL
ncbi:transmembrane protein 184C-like [Agrilus planipennis]|nr:transmembrane protein 184C-like [Agrilus planipennis]